MVAHAVGTGGLVFGLGQRREEQAGEDRDDGDHNEQLDQREPPGQAAVF